MQHSHVPIVNLFLSLLTFLFVVCVVYVKPKVLNNSIVCTLHSVFVFSVTNHKIMYFPLQKYIKDKYEKNNFTGMRRMKTLIVQTTEFAMSLQPNKVIITLVFHKNIMRQRP